jgi:hypothetical protein
VMTWCLCGDDMAHMVMINGDVDWAHHLIRESHVPTLGICVTNLGTHISHGECHIPAMERLLQNGMLHAQSDLELSLCEKSLNLW